MKFLDMFQEIRHSRTLRSHYWAKHLPRQYGPRYFSTFPDCDDLYFRHLSLRVDCDTAEILLKQYPKVCALHDDFGLSVETIDGTAVLSIAGMRIRLTSPGEIHILHEVLSESIYGIHLKQPTLIIDIGSNVGISALNFARFPEAHIVGFEPFPSTYECAKYNLMLNPELATRIDLRNYGLGNRNATEEWSCYPSNRGRSGEFGAGISEEIVGSGVREMVQIRSVTDVIRDCLRKSPEKDFMAKIDCEGGEFAVITSLDDEGLLTAFSVFMIEWHSRAGAPKVIIERLSKRGFQILALGAESRAAGMVYAFRNYI